MEPEYDNAPPSGFDVPYDEDDFFTVSTRDRITTGTPIRAPASCVAGKLDRATLRARVTIPFCD